MRKLKKYTSTWFMAKTSHFELIDRQEQIIETIHRHMESRER